MDFGNFWQKCYWESKQSKDVFPPHLTNASHYLVKCWKAKIPPFLPCCITVLLWQTSTSHWLNSFRLIICNSYKYCCMDPQVWYSVKYVVDCYGTRSQEKGNKSFALHQLGSVGLRWMQNAERQNCHQHGI